MHPLDILRTSALDVFARLVEIGAYILTSLVDLFRTLGAIDVGDDGGLLLTAFLAFMACFSGRVYVSLLFFA